ncbi:hypothetical protein CIY_15140 [Butyrivibrio fibrisolvens 16/4]|nr:hypothetical protein CIY_15140 [Butyrivibrio fibrisolvens 16/4]
MKTFERITRSIMVMALVFSATVMVAKAGADKTTVVDGIGTYQSKAGWSVKYDADLIEVNEFDDGVGFVYTGECAGTCMVVITNTPDKKAEYVRDDIAASWGSDNVEKYEAPLYADGAEVNAYWAYLGASEGDDGLYETAIAVEHNNGVILCECIDHMSGNEMMDMQVCDTLSMIIDSIAFN